MESTSTLVEAQPLDSGIVVFSVKVADFNPGLPEFEKSLSGHLTGREPRIILDLSETHYVGAAGWAGFLMAQKRATALGGEILLVGMRPEVRHAFELMGFAEVIRSYSDVKTAVRSGFHGPKKK